MYSTVRQTFKVFVSSNADYELTNSHAFCYSHTQN